MDAIQLDEEADFRAARRIADPEARAAHIGQACDGDAALRGRVERLLRAFEHEAGFLAAPACVATVDVPAAAERPGTTVGPYTLLEAIGEGGMGTVSMAEQVEPVRRWVALKVIKPGMDSKQVVADLAWFLATGPVAQLRDPARAVDLARTAVERAPQAQGRNTLGVAHDRAGDRAGAIAAREKSPGAWPRPVPRPQRLLPGHGPLAVGSEGRSARAV